MNCGRDPSLIGCHPYLHEICIFFLAAGSNEKMQMKRLPASLGRATHVAGAAGLICMHDSHANEDVAISGGLLEFRLDDDVFGARRRAGRPAALRTGEHDDGGELDGRRRHLRCPSNANRVIEQKKTINIEETMKSIQHSNEPSFTGCSCF